MSEIGFRLKNSARSIQIDSQFRNHCLLAKGRVTPSQTGDFDSSLRFEDVPLPLSTTPCIVAIRANNPAFYVMVEGHAVRLFSKTRTMEPRGWVDYFIFGTPFADPGGRPGLRIRNRLTGETVYNSLRKYLRVIRTYTGNEQNSGEIGAGRVCALVQNLRSYGARKQKAAGTNGSIIIEDVKSSTIKTPTDNSWEHRSGTVAQATRPWDGMSFHEYNYQQAQRSVTVIDVTDF